jgi:glycosyltransferase involved in cell wall biosynthesis
MAPLFSIIVPTRNRPDLLQDALNSLKLQHFSDFEIIISNNGERQRTRSIVNSFLDDKRFKYFEAPFEMSMPDHWQWAYQHSTGKFLLFLSDRNVLINGKLGEISRIISEFSDVEAISWPLASYDNDSKALHTVSATSIQPTDHIHVQTRDFWETLKTHRGIFSPVLPRGLNSFVKRVVYERISTHHGQIFRPISPDFTSGFSVVLCTDKLLHLCAPAVVAQANHLSNGGLIWKGVETGYVKALGNEAVLRHIPLRTIGVATSMHEDFYRVSTSFGTGDDWMNADRLPFYLDAVNDLQILLNATWPFKSDRFRLMERELSDALAQESEELKSKVRSARLIASSPKARIRAGLFNLTPGSAHRSLKWLAARTKGLPTFPTALAAAGFEHRHP